MAGRKRQELTGRRFGRLVVIRQGKIVRREYSYGWMTEVYWICACDCGAETEVAAKRLRNGQSKSCGCLRVEKSAENFRTHGESKGPEYKSWLHMNERCNNPSSGSFENYGGRGILCKFNTFDEFLEHVGKRPSKKHSIDRIDNDGHYEPGNVRWAVKTTQIRNRSNTVHLCYMGSDRPLAEWAEILGLDYGTLNARRLRGWHVAEEILFGRKRQRKKGVRPNPTSRLVT